MRRSFRTLRLCAIPQGFTLGWYAVPRWGTPNDSPPQSPQRQHEAVAGPVRSERRNVDTLIPVARPRESSSCPNVPCERRTGPAEPHRPISSRLRRGTDPQRQPRLCHCKTGERIRAYAAFLQNAPVVCHTPGFHPGLVCGAPLGHSERLTNQSLPAPPRGRSERRTGPAEPQQRHQYSKECPLLCK